MAPVKQRAVVVQEDGSVALMEKDVPKPGKGEILIKVVAVAQNPTDWKTAVYAKRAGSISGCDLSGVVEELGPDVPAGLRTVGERVATMIHGGCFQNGAFAEYAVAYADRVVHIPDSWSFEDAAQFGIAPLTAVQTLWETQSGLPTPLSPASTPGSIPILVWGGASSVGNYVIQMAKLSGLYVIATASPKNFELCKQLGADEVFDYKDADVTKKIKEAAQKISKGGLKHAVDCVSEGKTFEQVVETFGEEGGVFSAILRPPQADFRPDVTIKMSLAYDLMGKAFDFPRPFSPTPEDLVHGVKMWKLAQDILDTGKLKPSPTLIMPKGLASVQDGFKYMMEGKVSGQKITYRISDTPAL